MNPRPNITHSLIALASLMAMGQSGIPIIPMQPRRKADDVIDIDDAEDPPLLGQTPRPAEDVYSLTNSCGNAPYHFPWDLPDSKLMSSYRRSFRPSMKTDAERKTAKTKRKQRKTGRKNAKR